MKKENKIKRKNGLKRNKEGRPKQNWFLMKNDPWSDHPETQFGPTYPFFQNPEPRPTLRAVKVHFD